MRLTREILHSAATSGSGFRYAQLAMLGVALPPKKGWLSKLVGKEIPDELWQKVMGARMDRMKAIKFRKKIEREQNKLKLV